MKAAKSKPTTDPIFCTMDLSPDGSARSTIDCSCPTKKLTSTSYTIDTLKPIYSC